MFVVKEVERMRILQLTVLFVLGLAVFCAVTTLIDTISGGILSKWGNSPLKGNVGDDLLAIELVSLSVAVAVLACWSTVRLLGWKSVRNEIGETFKPMLLCIAGYSRFLLVVVSIVYMALGFAWTALAHFVVALALFIFFMVQQRAKERARDEADGRRGSGGGNDDDDGDEPA